jgi:hypothetical protein
MDAIAAQVYQQCTVGFAVAPDAFSTTVTARPPRAR